MGQHIITIIITIIVVMQNNTKKILHPFPARWRQLVFNSRMRTKSNSSPALRWKFEKKKSNLVELDSRQARNNSQDAHVFI